MGRIGLDVAESLGAAVLTVTVDDRQYQAGLRAAEQQAQVTGERVAQAFSKSGKPLQTAANGIQYFIDAQGRARSAAGQFLSTAERQAAGLDGVAAAAANAGAGFDGLGQKLAALGAGLVLTGFLRGSIDAASELETITRKLTNTLGPSGAAGALDFTRQLSQDLGLGFKTLAGSFSSFTAAATAANVPIQEQEQLFAAVSRAAQSLGLSNDEISGSLLALQQVASKGTVQMEELRGQLGERLPIAFSATAKGLGITQQELIKLVESGKLASGTFFTALTKGLNEITAGSGGVRTAAQEFQTLGNAWDELQTSLGQSALPTVKAGIQALTNAIKSVNSNLKAFVMITAGLGSAAAAFYLLAKATQVAATAQRALAVAAAVAQTVLSPAGALKAVAALGVGVAVAYGLGKAMEGAAAETEKAAKAADKTKENINAANAAGQKALEIAKKRTAEEQKGLDARLKRSLLDLELAGTQDQISNARKLATLEGTALLQLQNKIALNEKLRQQQAIQLELQRELAKPAGSGDGKDGARSSSKIDDLLAKQQKVNAEVRLAYEEAGVALSRNAKQAADALKVAQANLQSALRGGFDFLTPQLQQEQLNRARASIQPLVDRGVIRQGIDISTPDKLFQVAGFAESFSSAENELTKATKENALAIKALANKNWAVNVNVAADGSVRAGGDVLAGAM